MPYCDYCNRMVHVPCRNTRDMDPIDGGNTSVYCHSALVKLGGGERRLQIRREPMDIKIRDKDVEAFKKMIEEVIDQGSGSGCFDREHMVMCARLLLQIDDHEERHKPEQGDAPEKKSQPKKTW